MKEQVVDHHRLRLIGTAVGQDIAIVKSLLWSLSRDLAVQCQEGLKLVCCSLSICQRVYEGASGCNIVIVHIATIDIGQRFEPLLLILVESAVVTFSFFPFLDQTKFKQLFGINDVTIFIPFNSSILKFRKVDYIRWLITSNKVAHLVISIFNYY